MQRSRIIKHYGLSTASHYRHDNHAANTPLPEPLPMPLPVPPAQPGLLRSILNWESPLKLRRRARTYLCGTYGQLMSERFDLLRQFSYDD